MVFDPSQFDDLPIRAETLCALVEGELSDVEAEQVREQLLSLDPELARQVELMAHERVMVRTLGMPELPVDIAQSVVERLEREALLGLSAGSPSTGSLPISQMPEVRVRRGRWLTNPAGAGLAAAALIALAIGVLLQLGGGVQTVPPVPDPSPVPGVPDAVALGDAPAPRAVLSEVPSMPVVADIGAALATFEDTPIPRGPRVFSGDWDRALALLGDGRLLVRVRSVAPEETTSSLASISARQARRGEAWRLDADVDGPVAATMAAKFDPVPVEMQPILLADGGTGVRSQRLVRETAPRRTSLASVFIADLREDRAALASLVAALSLGDGRAAVFEELDEPLELSPVLTGESVLWWSRPASEWGSRRHVPVVVERLDR